MVTFHIYVKLPEGKSGKPGSRWGRRLAAQPPRSTWSICSPARGIATPCLRVCSTRCVEGQQRYPYSRAKGEPRSYQDFSKRMCRMIVWFWGSYSEPKWWILYDLHDSTGTFAGPLPPSSGGHFSAPDQQTPRGIEPAEQYPLCLLRVACHWWHWVLVLPYWEAFEKLLKKSRAACVGWMSSDGDLYPFDLWHYMHASKARRSRSGGNWCQPPTRLVFTQPYLHQAAPKHSRDRRLLKCDLGRLYDVIVYLTYPFWFLHII